MGQVIAVISSKGGCCKTTTAVCLAAEVAVTGRKVIVIDSDGPQHHASSWIRDGADLIDIGYLTGPSDLSGAIERARTANDFVIVDIIGADTATLSLAAANADLIIVPATASPLDADGVIRTVARLREIEDELQRRGLSRRLTHRVLLSRTEPDTTLYRLIKARLIETGIPLLKSEIRRRVAYQEAAFVGSAPAFMRDAQARREMTRLRTEVDELLATLAAPEVA